MSLKLDVSHYQQSYYNTSNSIGNLENIISEIEASTTDLSVLSTRLETLKEVITQEGRRKIFALPDNELIRKEKKVLSAIDVLIGLGELENEVKPTKEIIDQIVKMIIGTYRGYVFPLIELPA